MHETPPTKQETPPIQEGREVRPLLSMDYWYQIMLNPDAGKESKMLEALKTETPNLCSVTLERTCNLQCLHCIYQEESSSSATSRQANLAPKIQNIVKQLPGQKPGLLHEGRVLSPWHVELMAEASQTRPNLRLGLIDNGGYVKHIRKFKEQGVELDWIDISIDGNKATHNQQRQHDLAWDAAILGIERAREILKPHGEINTPYTLTNINFSSIRPASDYLLGKNLVNGMDITTMSPARPELQPYEIAAQQLRTAFMQAVEANQQYPNRVFFRLYRHQDLLKLASVLEKGRVWRIITGQEHSPDSRLLGVEVGKITFKVDGLPVTFSPLSLWPQETFLIDADGAYRTAYSIGYTLEELQRQKGNRGEDLSGYTVAPLNKDSNFRELYEKCVDQWWNFKGRKYLVEEKRVFEQLKTAGV